ncbi:MAG TPA: cytochrome c oxidase assembly protein [Acidimicrobiales bacterium]|nr:cytochrome c oxidase assembly protein [Acidimicrobiales bacterium]
MSGPPLIGHVLLGEPQTLAALALLGLAYAAGEARRRPAAAGRGRRRGRGREPMAFGAGIAVLVAALTGPLHGLADELFSAHMAQHVLLTAVAPPLLLLGRPGRRLLPLLPAGWRSRLGRTRLRARRALATGGTGTGMGLAVASATLVLWAWHLPFLYEAAVRDPAVHALEHALLLGTASWFWAEVIRLDRGGAHQLALFGLFVVGASGAALGVLLAFSGRVAYTVHAAGAARFGLTPLEDQQVAAVGMWMGGGLVYVAAAVVVASHWLAASTGGRSELPASAAARAGSRP